MAQQEREYKNILVIHFGQLGDVVLGLPALQAIKAHFAGAKITLLVGASAAAIAKLAEVADEYIIVDRVALRDGNKAGSIRKIFALVREVRRRKFDLVVDLNSLYETNILGFLSGAGARLYEDRENRSIPWLSRFPVSPPVEDKLRHQTDRYLAVLEPLGIYDVPRTTRVEPDKHAREAASRFIDEHDLAGKHLVGLFLGAGHPTRRWPVENFVALARDLSGGENIGVLIFLGPEERDMREGLSEKFGLSALIVDEKPLAVFYALLSRLTVLVSGDTGPMHLASLAGANVVLLSEAGSATVHRPLAEGLIVLEDRPLPEITADQVVSAVESLLRT